MRKFPLQFAASDATPTNLALIQRRSPAVGMVLCDMVFCEGLGFRFTKETLANGTRVIVRMMSNGFHCEKKSEHDAKMEVDRIAKIEEARIEVIARRVREQSFQMRTKFMNARIRIPVQLWAPCEAMVGPAYVKVHIKLLGGFSGFEPGALLCDQGSIGGFAVYVDASGGVASQHERLEVNCAACLRISAELCSPETVRT